MPNQKRATPAVPPASASSRSPPSRGAAVSDASPRGSKRRRLPPATSSSHHAGGSTVPDHATVAAPVDTQALASTITAHVLDQLRSQGVLPPGPDNVSATRATAVQGSSPDTGHPGSADESFPSAEAADLLSGAINQLAAGESPTDSDNTPSFQSAALPLGATVSLNIKNTIWAQEYVDLSVLLSPTMDDTYTVTVSKQGGRPNIGLSSGPRPKSVSSISEWTDAFAIYAAIYCDRFPQEAPQLWKYLSTVRGLSAKCPQRQWLYYDREFRKQRQVAPCSWGEVNWELYIMCTLPQPASSSLASRSGGPGQRPYTQKMCWRYNRTGFCSFPNCIFRHLCTSCHGRHPASRCGDRQPASARAIGKAPSNPRAPRPGQPQAGSNTHKGSPSTNLAARV